MVTFHGGGYTSGSGNLVALEGAKACRIGDVVVVTINHRLGSLGYTDLSAIGVRRVSVGSALSRAALGAFLRAAQEMRERGTFAFAAEAVGYQDISAMFGA